MINIPQDTMKRDVNYFCLFHFFLVWYPPIWFPCKEFDLKPRTFFDFPENIVIFEGKKSPMEGIPLIRNFGGQMARRQSHTGVSTGLYQNFLSNASRETSAKVMAEKYASLSPFKASVVIFGA